MTKKYCVYCGTEYSMEDKFCFKCGAKVNIKESMETPVKSSKVSDYYIPEPTTEEPRKQSKINVKKFITVTFIIGVILVPIFVTMGVLSIKVPLGTLDYEVPLTSIYDLDLVIDNDIGSITITYDDTISNVFEAELYVKGGLKASLSDAVNFDHEVVNNRTIISFNSGERLFSYFSMKSILYEIEILVNPIAIYNFEIITATGNIDFYLDDNDVQIENLSLITSTGSIEFESGATNNVTMQDVLLRSSTESITFDMSKATNTMMHDLYLVGTTGSIYANLGTNAALFSDDIIIQTSTGSIKVYYKDIILTDNIIWHIETSTGSITMGIEQTVLPALNVTSVFDIQTSTGSISVDCQIDSNIGIEMNADTSTGSITIPGGSNYYISPNYETANIQYSFILITSTGSITASVEN